MTTYWKSQGRKFCEYCKCWTADNRSSIEFHEKGKNHKANIVRKIADCTKKGTAAEKKKKENDAAFKQMEMAALKAMEKDVEANPDLAAKYGMKPKPKVKPEEFTPAFTPVEGPSMPPANYKPPVDPAKWEETKSPEGYKYYWNSETGETTWEEPEGYVSSSERLKPDVKEPDTESNSKATSETTNTTTVATADIPLPTQRQHKTSQPPMRPHKPTGFSQWETVTHTEEEFVDLQLPVTKELEEVAPPIVYHEEPKIKFKEKKFISLAPDSNSSGIAFKKRKIGGGRNLKQRSEDS